MDKCESNVLQFGQNKTAAGVVVAQLLRLTTKKPKCYQNRPAISAQKEKLSIAKEEVCKIFK